jgi:oligoendopeptidase F
MLIRRLPAVLTPALALAALLTTAAAPSVAAAAAAAADAGAKGNSPAGAAPVPTAEWDLSDLYPTAAAWQDSYTRTSAAADKLGALKGTLGTNADAMLHGLATISDLNREAVRVFVYAQLGSDRDLRVGANLERKQQAQSLLTRIGENSSWVAPELLGIGAERIKAMVQSDPELKRRFGHYLDDTLRAAPHTLGAEAEQVLAATGDVLAQPGTLHSQFSNAELPVPTVTLSDGSQVRLTQPAFQKTRQTAVRADRKLVFDQYFGTWKKFEGTAGSMLTTQIMGDHFNARSRHFDSALQAAQFPDNMPDAVYRALVREVNAALPTLYRYLKLRKRLLAISDDLQYYDNYAPLFKLEPAPSFDLAASERITLAALQPLGADYLGMMQKGFASRWMSAYPQDGKQLGAYMQGSAYDVHPYLLLNHTDDYTSLSTLAHEWGHAVHTMLAARAQPFEKASYSTFIAESASIGNEMLLNDYLVAHAANRAEKLYYLGQGVESIRTTYFRQSMFAEFELAIHEELEQGKPLSGERMTEMYCGLVRKYYGEAEGVMKIDPAYCIEWAMVPHFYRNFYVYQYATSMAGAASLTASILKQGAPARARFLELLSAGGSDYPYELYKRAGIDMATPEPYRALAARMNALLDQIDELLRSP